MMLCASFTLPKHVSEKDSPKPFLVHNLINSIIAYAVLMINIQPFKENLSPSTEANEGYRKKEKKKNKIEHKRANKYSEKQIRDIAAQQDKLPGQKRTKIVSDFRYPVVIAQFLKNLDFPAHKNTVIQFILDIDSESIDSSQISEMLSLLQQIQEKSYKNVSDIIDALDLVRPAT
jgi:hypothetical protein